MPRPRIVVADDHDNTRAAIASLLASHFDVVSTVTDGQSAVEAVRALRPAVEVLSHLMVGDRPDAQRFSDTIHPLMDKAAGSSGRPVRIYGDMVDVLWRSGREEAALSLEMLGHQLVAARKCSILCAYSAAVGRGKGFNTICDLHSHVVPSHIAL